MSDLIERLRAQAAYDQRHYPPVNPLWTEAADEIERLRAELRRYEETHWAEMSDEDMGRAFKAFAQTVTDWSGTEWKDEGERRLGLMQMGLMQAVRMAAESNAETFSTAYSGFHSGGVQYGDWAVTIARTQPPTDRKEA